MEQTYKNIAYLIWSSLRDAFKDIGVAQLISGNSLEFYYNRIVYSKEYGLVVIEIVRSQFKNLPVGLFETKNVKHTLLSRTNCKRIDIEDLGESIFFYFWISSEEEKPINMSYETCTI